MVRAASTIRGSSRTRESARGRKPRRKISRPTRTAAAHEVDRVREASIGLTIETSRLLDVRSQEAQGVILLTQDLRLVDLPAAVRWGIAERLHDVLADLADRASVLAEIVLAAGGKPYPDER